MILSSTYLQCIARQPYNTLRLLHTETLEIREFLRSQILPYAILSHGWGDREVTYQDMRRWLRGVVEKKVGFVKIQNCCEQAATDELAYA
jgi:hypothetical protein